MEFVERYSLYLSLSFSLVSFDTSPHFPVLFPPSRKFQKSQGPRTKGHCLGDDKHPPVCFGVLSRKKFGRPPFWAVSFQPSLENDAVAFPRTAKSSPPSLPPRPKRRGNLGVFGGESLPCSNISRKSWRREGGRERVQSSRFLWKLQQRSNADELFRFEMIPFEGIFIKSFLPSFFFFFTLTRRRNYSKRYSIFKICTSYLTKNWNGIIFIEIKY